jgi:hypothetical protein
MFALCSSSSPSFLVTFLHFSPSFRPLPSYSKKRLSCVRWGILSMEKFIRHECYPECCFN